MGEKIVVGPVGKGFKTDREPFYIDNDSFPVLINAYQWRGRVKRKRGTEPLGRLQRFFNSSSVSYNTGSTTITFDGSGNANLITGFSLQTNASIVPGTVTIVASGGPTTYTDPTKDGFLTPTGTGGPNTINYATGAILIPVQAGNTATATFVYNPALPVMGLEDLVLDPSNFPGTLAFDTVYSYNISTTSPYSIYDVSFYKNPATATYTNYVQKTNPTPTTWNGQNYQQFWTTNYQGALWTTNGISIPFSITNVGMQYKAITGVTISVGPPPTATLTIAAHGLVVGDFVFINEVGGITGINFQTGYVTTVVDANHVIVTLPNATLGGAYTSGGIAQYLTNRSSTTVDSLRWYDGDPTNGSASSPVLNKTLGWVNFSPPLSQAVFSISDLPAAQYYLVGARVVLPFKDRLLFFGPVVQTSSPGSQVYLPDTVIYSQNGTPYYTASFSGSPLSPTNLLSILVPANQTATPTAYWEDQIGFGGFVSAGLQQAIVTVSPNEDVLIIGFTRLQARFIYTGDDLIPFNFFIVNSEFGSSSTFSIINLDKGVLTLGSRGFAITEQTGSARFDLEIPDSAFEITRTNNGFERVCAQRDFINEWIYFTYVSDSSSAGVYLFPNQSLLYNYRENTWAIINELYTTYGNFQKQTGDTWNTIGLRYPTWRTWNDPWNSGTSELLEQQLLGGNTQGFILIKDVGTGEAPSLAIQSFSGNTITSPDHGLNQNDFIIINNCLGTIADVVNLMIFQVTSVTRNTFTISTTPSGSYSGGGTITRMYRPFIQTKQFPVSWGMGRKTRIGPQMYLLTTTDTGQIQLLIFLSQNNDSPYNSDILVPDLSAPNNSLVYSTVLYTCPESTNLGLTPANTNLNMPTAAQQSQIWHRINTSLIGDTIQFGFTMSDAQMSSLTPSGNPFTITGATQANPCVLTCASNFSVGNLVLINGVSGMTQLNGNTYQVSAVSSTTVTILVDSTAFSAYSAPNNGTATQLGSGQFDEIELHGFVLDVSPSQLLA